MLIKRCVVQLTRPGWLKLFLIVLSVVTVNAAYAQNCDPYLPCGPLPWNLPALPNLSSPSPFPTMVLTTVPPTPTGTLTITPTSTPIVTLTPAPTVTPFWDATALSDGMGTLEAQIGGTPVPVLDFDGNPINTGELTENTGIVWNYIRGLTLYDFGVFTPLMAAWAFTFVYVIGFKVMLLLFPALVYLFGWLRKIVQLILDFIPG